MAKYFCPYCNPKYQFHKNDNKGYLYCGICGEYLVKKTQTKRILLSIFGIFLIVLSFICILLFSIGNYQNENKKYYQLKITSSFF